MSWNLTNDNERGEAMTVVVICLVIGLLFALGWIFWQNFIHKDETATSTDVIVVEKKKEDVDKQTESKEVQQQDNPHKGYLAIEEWKVRFKIPEAIENEQVMYENTEAVLGMKTFGLMTSGEKDAYRTCGMSPSPQVRISRGKNSQSTPDRMPLNGGRAIGGFYYYLHASIYRCETTAGQKSEAKYQNILKGMADTIVAY